MLSNNNRSSSSVSDQSSRRQTGGSNTGRSFRSGDSASSSNNTRVSATRRRLDDKLVAPTTPFKHPNPNALGPKYSIDQLADIYLSISDQPNFVPGYPLTASSPHSALPIVISKNHVNIDATNAHFFNSTMECPSVIISKAARKPVTTSRTADVPKPSVQGPSLPIVQVATEYFNMYDKELGLSPGQPFPLSAFPIIEKLSWWYRDASDTVRGPFSTPQMRGWFASQQILPTLQITCSESDNFCTLDFWLRCGRPAFMDYDAFMYTSISSGYHFPLTPFIHNPLSRYGEANPSMMFNPSFHHPYGMMYHGGMHPMSYHPHSRPGVHGVHMGPSNMPSALANHDSLCDSSDPESDELADEENALYLDRQSDSVDEDDDDITLFSKPTAVVNTPDSAPLTSSISSVSPKLSPKISSQTSPKTQNAEPAPVSTAPETKVITKQSAVVSAPVPVTTKMSAPTKSEPTTTKSSAPTKSEPTTTKTTPSVPVKQTESSSSQDINKITESLQNTQISAVPTQSVPITTQSVVKAKPEPAKPAWGAAPAKTPVLKSFEEIQREEAESRRREIETRQQAEKSQKEAYESSNQSKSFAALLGADSGTTAIQTTSTKTFAEIQKEQAEEYRKIREAEATKPTVVVQAVAPASQHKTAWGQTQAPVAVGIQAAQIEASKDIEKKKPTSDIATAIQTPVASGTTSSSSSSSTSAPAPKPSTTTSTSNSTPSTKKADDSNKKWTMSRDLEAWCREELKSLTGADEMTIFDFVMTLDDESMIHDTIEYNIGSKHFADMFMQHRSFDMEVSMKGSKPKQVASSSTNGSKPSKTSLPVSTSVSVFGNIASSGKKHKKK